MKLNIEHIIRDAILNNQVRRYQLLHIQAALGVSRAKAKQLFFAFIYRATNTRLLEIANSKDEECMP